MKSCDFEISYAKMDRCGPLDSTTVVGTVFVTITSLQSTEYKHCIIVYTINSFKLLRMSQSCAWGCESNGMQL